MCKFSPELHHKSDNTGPILSAHRWVKSAEKFLYVRDSNPQLDYIIRLLATPNTESERAKDIIIQRDLAAALVNLFSMQPTNTPQKPERQSKKAPLDLEIVWESTVSRGIDKGSFISTPNWEQSAALPINKYVEREHATPMTEHSIKYRIEQPIESIRERRKTRDDAPLPIGIGATPRVEQSAKDRVEQLIDSIRGRRTTSEFATVPGLGARNPRTVMVQDARYMLATGYHWSFDANGRAFGNKTKVIPKTKKTTPNPDNSSRYPWSGPPTVEKHVVVPVGLVTGTPLISCVNDARTLVPEGYYWSFSAGGGTFGKKPSPARTTKTLKAPVNIGPLNPRLEMPLWGGPVTRRKPAIFPGFAIGGSPSQPTYYPLLPVPLTSRVD